MLKGNYSVVNEAYLNGKLTLACVSMGSDTEEFFWMNYDQMTKEAESSFLKALRIPVGFFRKLDNDAKKKVIHSQTQLLLSDEKLYTEAVWVLHSKVAETGGTRIMYVGRKVATPFGEYSPEQFFFDEKDKWTLYEVNFEKGTVSYLRLLEPDNRGIDAYYTAAVCTFSLLYQRDVSLVCGLFKPANQCFLIDASLGKQFTWKCAKYDSVSLENQVSVGKAVGEYAVKHEEDYKDCEKQANERPFSYERFNNTVSEYEWVVKNPYLRKVCNAYITEYVKKKDELESKLRNWGQFVTYAFDTISVSSRDLRTKLKLGEALYHWLGDQITPEPLGVRIEGGQQ